MDIASFVGRFRDKEDKQYINRKIERERYSLWMDMLYRLSLSNHVSSFWYTEW